MPRITVSDNLYRRLEDVSGDRETEQAMWEMLYLFERGNNPAE